MAATHIASRGEHWNVNGTSKAKLLQSECIPVDRIVERNIPSTTNGDSCGTAAQLPAASIKPPTNGTMNNGCSSSTSKTFMKPPSCIVSAPYDYISSLPSKNVRDTFIDSFNKWIQVPEPSFSSIKAIIGMLHHSSLMLDDIEDGSKLRRGKPAVHMLFGAAQTINSANYIFVNAFTELENLHSPDAAKVFTEELRNLHCGQGLDLYWKYHTHCPTVEEYMMMVDNKTGGLFRLCVRLMQAEAGNRCQDVDFDYFVTQLGRYFQIRDDYQNLTSAEYTNQKGFCEDLDEGKISLPFIYCLTGTGPKQDIIRGIFQHKSAGELPMEMKEFILGHMKEVGSLDSTLSLLRNMQQDMVRELHKLEALFGSENADLHLVLRKLQV